MLTSFRGLPIANPSPWEDCEGSPGRFACAFFQFRSFLHVLFTLRKGPFALILAKHFLVISSKTM